MSSEALLTVDRLTVEYGRGRQRIRAVDEVSFEVLAGETVGLVGESGSGKTTIARAVLGLTPVTAGSVVLAGEDITRATRRRRRQLSRSVQMVFQDPYGALNPARTIGESLAEPLLARPTAPRERRHALVERALDRVGLPAATARRHPAELSGGQLQRVSIARALMALPALVICDEPVSALDTSVQAQIINLLADLQQEHGLSYLFVAHDLAVVRHLSQRLVVLLQGRVMEAGPVDLVYTRPAHPYTRALVAAAAGGAAVAEPAAAVRPPAAGGCRFATRCPEALAVCHSRRPPATVTAAGVTVACHRYEDPAAGRPPDRPAGHRLPHPVTRAASEPSRP
ncbi:ABC transporter ATP-binding protein [Micromonospora chersina]|uniref:ABC transporter ATP-binding protein n=1 Tax=Micromonospora chersina TaxID=47854 RepID=UPI0033F4FF2E